MNRTWTIQSQDVRSRDYPIQPPQFWAVESATNFWEYARIAELSYFDRENFEGGLPVMAAAIERAEYMTLSSKQIFDSELDVINFRRKAIREGRVAKARNVKQPTHDDHGSEALRHYVTDRKQVIQQDDDAKAETRGTSRLSGARATHRS